MHVPGLREFRVGEPWFPGALFRARLLGALTSEPKVLMILPRLRGSGVNFDFYTWKHYMTSNDRKSLYVLCTSHRYAMYITTM
jgi:hypothetical protein